MDYDVELGRRERKRQAVHQGLLDAAERLFAEQGVGGTTVEDIAEAADVARQTVFNHFPYKEALALELGADMLGEVANKAQGLLENGVAAVEVLEEIGCSILDCAREQRRGELTVVVAQELLHADPERAVRARALVPMAQLLESILQQALEEGSIRSDLALDRVAARLSMAIASIVLEGQRVEHSDLRRELQICLDIYLNGIAKRRL